MLSAAAAAAVDDGCDDLGDDDDNDDGGFSVFVSVDEAVAPSCGNGKKAETPSEIDERHTRRMIVQGGGGVRLIPTTEAARHVGKSAAAAHGKNGRNRERGNNT